MAEQKENKDTLGLNVKKDENFSEWYTQVIQKADLADYSAVSGCIVFKPNSYSIWEKIKSIVDERLKEMGVKNAYFPLFIPEKLLMKEAKHMEGFSPEVAWVTESGSKLDERLAVRPTSETIMYDSYSRWIRSWRDLPLKINQWNNVVRWEFKHAVPFLRTREFLWNEGHTVFATKEESEKEAKEILDMYYDVLQDYLALYGIKGKKTENEKFAGAEYTTAIELLMPNGRAIQGPDAHVDGQNFAKAFDIKYLDKDGKLQYAWQNTWAITTRMIGVLIAVHGDDRGAVLPPKIAPVQAVIVPILFEKTKDTVLKKAREIKESLKDFSVLFDDRDECTSGWKFNEWEMKGVPLRIEVGPRDLEKNQVVLVRRDNGQKEFADIKGLNKKVSEVLDRIQNDMFEKSKSMTLKNTVDAADMKGLKKAIGSGKMADAVWCKSAECEAAVKEKTEGAKIICIPLEEPKKKGKCVCCGKSSDTHVLIAKSY